MRQGTYRLATGALVHCRLDESGAMRVDVELSDGRRERDVSLAGTAGMTLLSDDPTWPSHDERVAVGVGAAD